MSGRGYSLGVRRGSWEERLGELLAAQRAAHPERARAALVVEPGAEALADLLAPHLGPDVLHITGGAAPVCLGEHLEALTAAHEDAPLVCVAVAGVGDRADGRKAAWKLGPLADLIWVFIHPARPTPGLVRTVGQHVRLYLEVVDGLAYHEGPEG